MTLEDAIWIKGNPDEPHFAKDDDLLTVECYLQALQTYWRLSCLLN